MATARVDCRRRRSRLQATTQSTCRPCRYKVRYGISTRHDTTGQNAVTTSDDTALPYIVMQSLPLRSGAGGLPAADDGGAPAARPLALPQPDVLVRDKQRRARARRRPRPLLPDRARHAGRRRLLAGLELRSHVTTLHCSLETNPSGAAKTASLHFLMPSRRPRWLPSHSVFCSIAGR